MQVVWSRLWLMLVFVGLAAVVLSARSALCRKSFQWKRLTGRSAAIRITENDGRTFWVRPVSPDVLRSGNVVATALAASLDKPFPWAVGFFFGDTELSMKLWNVIAGLSGFDD